LYGTGGDEPKNDPEAGDVKKGGQDKDKECKNNVLRKASSVALKTFQTRQVITYPIFFIEKQICSLKKY
jgi:hypothetical protein